MISITFRNFKFSAVIRPWFILVWKLLHKAPTWWQWCAICGAHASGVDNKGWAAFRRAGPLLLCQNDTQCNF